MNINYTEKLPDKEPFLKLFNSTGWNESYKLNSSELHLAIVNSWFTISAYDNDKLVGFGRIVSDGIVHAMIYDMILLTDYQRKGIGSIILKKLLEHCLQNNIRDIQLFSADGKMGFYEKHGFDLRSAKAQGMEIKNYK